MNLNDFYSKYNLNHDCFSGMAGVGVSTLKKYSKGETIRNDAKERIELSMIIIEENNLIRPKYCGHYMRNHFTNAEYHKDIKKYEFEFQRLLRNKRV